MLQIAHNTLEDKALAVTAVSSSLPRGERDEARQIARWIGAQHVEFESREQEDPNYLANTPRRCFFCKNEVFSLLVEYASQHGFETVADGTNADDLGDHRPGRQAARYLAE